MQTEKYQAWSWVRQLATVVPCILCLATTVWSSNDERALGAGYWPRGMCGALGVRSSGRQGLKESWQACAGQGQQHWKMCVLWRKESCVTGKTLRTKRRPRVPAWYLEGRLEIVGDTQPPKQCLWMHVSFFSFSFLIKTPEASAEMVLWHFVSHILLGHNHCYTLKNTIHKPFLCPLFSLSLICFPLSPTEGDSSTLEGTEVPPEWQGVMSSFSASSPLMRACKNDLRPCWGKSPVTKIGKTTNNLITHTN